MTLNTFEENIEIVLHYLPKTAHNAFYEILATIYRDGQYLLQLVDTKQATIQQKANDYLRIIEEASKSADHDGEQ